MPINFLSIKILTFQTDGQNGLNIAADTNKLFTDCFFPTNSRICFQLHCIVNECMFSPGFQFTECDSGDREGGQKGLVTLSYFQKWMGEYMYVSAPSP